MSVGLLLVTHEGIAQNMLDTAKKILGVCPLATRALEVPLDIETDIIQQQAINYIDILNKDHGVLMLTDLYGSTPSNICHQLINQADIKLVSGLNLPMLVRILNYPQLNLQDMTLKALSGGHDGIRLCDYGDSYA
ncbi:MAG: PTS fructose transporter subunit IIA [Gammaproteobacteria bacterium]|nr:PTS fructose transporter subunit IIA [Gammaproteobacteria bacterium]